MARYRLMPPRYEGPPAAPAMPHAALILRSRRRVHATRRQRPASPPRPAQPVAASYRAVTYMLVFDVTVTAAYAPAC